MGDDAINFTHVMSAAQIFELSLETLTEKFPTKAWANGVDENLLKLYDCILEKCPVGHNKREIQKECNISNDDLTTLTKLKALTRFDDGTYFVNADWKEGKLRLKPILGHI